MRNPIARALPVVLLVLLGGCVTHTARETVESITPGVSARIPAGLTRVPDYHGIDSDVARFEGRGSAVSFDRGMYGGQIHPEAAITASTTLATGQTLDRSAITEEGGDYTYALRLVERATAETPVVGVPYVPPIFLAISVLCQRPADCEAIADTIQSSLSIGKRFPSDL